MIEGGPILTVRPLPEGSYNYNLRPRHGDDYVLYARLLCHLVKHVANCFRVPEAEVWKWVEHERAHPTKTSRER